MIPPHTHTPTIGRLPLQAIDYIEEDDYDAFSIFGEQKALGANGESFPIGEREWGREFIHPLAED